MLVKTILVFVLVLVVVMIVVGIALIRDSYKPFRDEKGEPRTLTSFEKVILAIAGSALVIGLLSLFLPDAWIRKLKGHKA